MTAVLERPSRAQALKALTHAAHERLDKAIMAGRPFESRERYGLFLSVQWGFHREIDALYSNPELDRLLPDLPGRRRFDLISQDLADLGLPLPAATSAPRFGVGEAVDIPTALGWLYVAEGSNLGAAFLLKAAAGLGLSETLGARHLAAAPEGRGLHWKTFTAALDATVLDDAAEARAAAGAEAAFNRVADLVAVTFR
ncbi:MULTISPECIES: biliverdin-producing heme oxygenase [unclassified Xanthobacter]|uniref:biliverdin-producing heme oxygenase n=1 Tax=unclassified Xanthobacter TaxID=2623496 RepID=UPI001EDF7739|nr:MULTISPECIES: biliverdin-producing heme oxygenase [unclassified Xanthobacter]